MYVYICIHIHTYTYIHIHTHIYTYIQVVYQAEFLPPSDAITTIRIPFSGKSSRKPSVCWFYPVNILGYDVLSINKNALTFED